MRGQQGPSAWLAPGAVCERLRSLRFTPTRIVSPQPGLASAPATPTIPAVPLRLRLPFWIATLSACAGAVAYALTFADIAFHPILFLLPVFFLVWFLVLQQWRRVPRRNLQSEIFGDIPRWMKAAAAALLVFAFANFFACIAGTSTHPGPAAARGSEPPTVAISRSAAETIHVQALQLRMLSGFFVCCFGLAALLVETCWIKNGPAMADRKI